MTFSEPSCVDPGMTVFPMESRDIPVKEILRRTSQISSFLGCWMHRRHSQTKHSSGLGISSLKIHSSSGMLIMAAFFSICGIEDYRFNQESARWRFQDNFSQSEMWPMKHCETYMTWRKHSGVTLPQAASIETPSARSPRLQGGVVAVVPEDLIDPFDLRVLLVP